MISVGYHNDKNFIINIHKDVVKLVESKYRFINGWVSQATRMLMLEDPSRDEKKIRKALTKYAEKNIKNPGLSLVNNYRHVCRRDGMLELCELLLSGQVILGGDGNLYLQHDAALSILYKVIKNLQDKRNADKAKRSEYDKVLEAAIWLYYDIKQGNDKVAVNALYGVLGYMRFPLFNVNLAQSITSFGQMIISTATCCFENFMSDNIKLVSFTELISYIYEIDKEYHTLIEKDDFDKKVFTLIDDVTVEDTIKRLIRKIDFELSSEEMESIFDILTNMNSDALKMVMYKNNLEDFNNTEFMKYYYTKIFNEVEKLTIPEMWAFDNTEKSGTVASPEAKDDIKYLFFIYDVFVHYNHPIFDKVRRCKYTDKHAVLYIDTDSNFIGLDEFITWSANLMGTDPIKDTTFIFKAESIFTMILSYVIKMNYVSFYQSLNIAPEHGSLIKMKNEFFFPIIFFGLAKKRYIGLMMLQEGKILNNGLGLPEIKGFDFKKAGTKKFVADRFERIIEEEILRTPQIDLASIYRKFDDIKKDIRVSLLNGETTFYKQATVKPMDQYKQPFSNQASKAGIIWNFLCPTNELELPAEVDLIPINVYNGVSDAKLNNLREVGPEMFFKINKNVVACENLYRFYESYPDQFNIVWSKIINSPNEHIRKLNLNVIAKPRSMTEIPDWLKSIIDIEKIVMDVVKLSNPILEPLGFDIQSASAQVKHYSNIIYI